MLQIDKSSDDTQQMMQLIKDQKRQIQKLKKQLQKSKQQLSPLNKYSTSKQQQKLFKCPLKHDCFAIEESIQFCHNCKFKKYNFQKMRGLSCKRCNYTICKKCKEPQHHQLCPSKYYNYHDKQLLCYKCEVYEVGGVICRNCSFNLCLVCFQKQV